MTTYRPEFEAALRLFARASTLMVGRGFRAPILVGGAAVEAYSASVLVTGDFDIVTGRQEEFEHTLQGLGFNKYGGLGHTALGWVHPDLALGFEVVASSLFDGLADHTRIMFVDLDQDGTASVVSVEDMIADRLGQYASGSAPEMLRQAQTLFALHRDADLAYMEMRIRHETAGEFGVATLKS